MSAHENLTRDEAKARAALLADLHYDVHLDLTQGDETFGSRVEGSFTCLQPGAETFLDCTATEVSRVVLNGEELDLEGRVSPTRIALPALTGENTLVVEATMAYQHIGKGLSFFRDPSDDAVYLHSQFEPFDAHLVYACFDQPDLKATFDFAVDAPADWVVVSNMAATDRPDEGAAGTWRFGRTPKVSTYITAIVAGAYASVHDRHGDTDLGLYIRRSLVDHLEQDEIFEITKQGLDWFAEAFGMQYPFGKYDQLFVPEFQAGAMENPGCITFSESYVFRSRVTEAQRERRAETILHEMAHMWFGDLVTMRWWDDLWLNESFATFMSQLAEAEATRFTNAWVTFLDAEKAWAKMQDQLPTTHPVAADMVDIESVHQNFDGITYAKGASVLRQLVAWVGQDEFLEGCRRYFAKHAYDNAELRDFLSALEDASGRELSGWVEEWLRTTGVNTFDIDYRVDDEGLLRDVTIGQRAEDPDETLRRHRVAVGVYAHTDEGIIRTHREELDVHGASTAVPQLDGVPAGDLVLVNDDDLTYAKIVIDDRSMEALTASLDQLVEPLPRALVWGATWDMVRDGELPARRYAELVRRNAPSETEVGVLQRLLMRSAAAIERYGDPASAAAELARSAEHAREQLEAAEPGSGPQLVWAKHWAATARAGQQRDDVRRLLDGDLTFEGLELDTDLRWALVISLAVSGAVDQDVIDAEYERDHTDIGERHRETALAARPSAEAKAAAWSRLLDEDLSLTVSRNIWAGFNRLSQTELIEPYVDRYFDALDTVWEERPLDWAIEFVEGTYPHPVATQALLDRTDEVLAGELPGPVRRTLMEQRDTLRRTLKARATDASA